MSQGGPGGLQNWERIKLARLEEQDKEMSYQERRKESEVGRKPDVGRLERR